MLAVSVTHAENPDLGELVHKYTKALKSEQLTDDEILFALWIHEDLVKIRAKILKEKGRSMDIDTSFFEEYQIFALIKGKVINHRPIFSTTFDLIGNSHLKTKDSKSASISTLSNTDLPDNLRKLLEIYKNDLQQAYGPTIGTSLEFYFFKGNYSDKLGMSDSNLIELTVYDTTLTWSLPSVEFLPKMLDPSTGKKFPGDYKYSPYSGARLEQEKVEPVR